MNQTVRSHWTAKFPVLVSRQAVNIPKGEITADILVIGNAAAVSGVVSLDVGSVLVVAVRAMRLDLSAGVVSFPVVISVILISRLGRPISYIEKSARPTGLIGLLASMVVVELSGIIAVAIMGSCDRHPVVLVNRDWGGGPHMRMRMGWKHGETWRSGVLRLVASAAWLHVRNGFWKRPLVVPILLTIAWVVGVGGVTMWLLQLWQSHKIHRMASEC